MKQLIMAIFCLLLGFSQINNAYAQDQDTTSATYVDPMQDMMIVGACTAGGAILGLSTLPFTEEPSEHFKNVLVGGAVGLIIGVAVVAYSQANETQGQFSGTTNTPGFETHERKQLLSSFEASRFNKTPSQIGYSFSF